MVISVPEFGANPADMPQIISSAQPSGQVIGQVTGEVTGEVLKLLKIIDGELKRSEIQQLLGLKHEDHFREAYLLPALSAEFIEMTIPEKPTSSKQKYRLTDKGQAIVKGRE